MSILTVESSGRCRNSSEYMTLKHLDMTIAAVHLDKNRSLLVLDNNHDGSPSKHFACNVLIHYMYKYITNVRTIRIFVEQFTDFSLRY